MAINKRVQILLKARDDAGQVLDKFERKADKVSRSLKKAGLVISGAGAAMGLALGKSVSVAANFEDSMRRVAAVSGATGEEFDKLRNTALELGRTTRFTATEVADGLFFLAQSGASVEEQIATIPQVLDLASASGMELGRTSDLLTDIMEAFGMEAHESARAADVLAATVTQTSTDLEQLAQGMKFIAPQANAFGMDIEETAAALGLFAEGGFKGAMGGTAMRQIMLKLLRVAPQTEKTLRAVADIEEEFGENAGMSAMEVNQAADVLRKYNIQVLDANGNLKKFADLFAELEKAGASQQEWVKLFGARVGQVDFMMRQGSDTLNALTADLRNSNGRAREMAKTMEDSLAGSMREFQSASEGLAISMGDTLIPALTTITEIMTSVLTVINNLPGPLKAVATWTLAVGAGLATVVGPGLIIAGFLPSAVEGFMLLAKAIKVTAVAMTAQLIPAMIKTITRIYAMVAARIALLAVSGPAGWAMLAGAGAVAAAGGFALAKATDGLGFAKRHLGGMVPGAAGTEVPIMAKAGERVVDSHMAGGMGGGSGEIHVHFHSGVTMANEMEMREAARALQRYMRDENRTRLSGREI